MAKQNKSETKGCYWGINEKGGVEQIWETKEGRSIVLTDSNFRRHPVMKGQRARIEVVVVFGLRDIEYVPASSFGTDYEKRKIAELEEKAKK